MRCLFLATALALLAASAAVAEDSLETWVDENLGSVVALYKELHQAPELSFQEEQTSSRLATELRELGCDVTERVGGFGVVALLANGSGPVIMLRADMDGLPIVEETGVDYASRVTTKDARGATVGVMHACGHDIHMANLIGVVRYLSTHRDGWSGTLMAICQPAEERGSGARTMLEDGLFGRFPRPQYAIALHVSPAIPAGRVGYRAGYALANVDSVDVTIRGRGGHGAYPHTTIDPVVIAARFVLDLQSIVSREIKPIEPAVITVGSIRGGTKHNIIGDECDLQLTVRSYTPAVRQQLLAAIERKAQAAAHSSNAPEPVISTSEGTPALYNDDQLVARVAPVFKRVLGDDGAIEIEPSMGGEDFSRYGLAGVPILMYWVGAIVPNRLEAYQQDGGQPPSLHSASFYPDPEPTLRTALLTMTSAALELMPPVP